MSNNVNTELEEQIAEELESMEFEQVWDYLDPATKTMIEARALDDPDKTRDLADQAYIATRLSELEEA